MYNFEKAVIGEWLVSFGKWVKYLFSLGLEMRLGGSESVP